VVITHFRLEGLGHTREQCVDELIAVATKVMEVSGVNLGQWEVTDDVVERKGQVYRGRMVYKAQLHPKPVSRR
jgi:hypothetical protein